MIELQQQKEYLDIYLNWMKKWNVKYSDYQFNWIDADDQYFGEIITCITPIKPYLDQYSFLSKEAIRFISITTFNDLELQLINKLEEKNIDIVNILSSDFYIDNDEKKAVIGVLSVNFGRE